MADTRIFKMTRQYPGYARRDQPGRVEYGDRKSVSGRCSRPRGTYEYGPVIKVEATNPEATEGWTDVTSEFISS